MHVTTSIIDLSAVSRAPVSSDPYPHFIGSSFLYEDVHNDLRRDFPSITKPGFLTVSEIDIHGCFRCFIEELEGSKLSNAVGEKINMDLDRYPRLTTIRRFSQQKDGRIHTDSESKLATFLVYFNDSWNASEGGCLRVLRSSQDFDDMVAEIPPITGNIFGFKRTENSWHGHKPFVGERRVVQITWLRDTSDLERKKKRNKLAQLFKGILGG